MNLQLLYTAFQGLAALFILYTVIPGSQLQKYNPLTPKTTFPPYYTPSATHDIDDSFLKRTDIWLDFDTIGKISGIHKLGIVPATPSDITPSQPRISALGMNVLYSDLQKASPQPFTRNFPGKNSSAINNSGIIIALTSIIGIFLGVITLFVGKPVSGNLDKKALISSNTTDNQEILKVPTRFALEVASLSQVVNTVESQRPSPFGTPSIISGGSHMLSPFALPSPLTTTPCAKYDAKLASITALQCDLVKPISPLDANGPIIGGPTTSLLPSVDIDSSVCRLIRCDHNQSPVESASRLIHDGSKVVNSPCSSLASPAIRSYSYSQGTPLSSLGNFTTELTPETCSIRTMHAWYDRKDMARLDSLLESFMEDDEDFTHPSGVTSDGEMKEHLLVIPQRLGSPSASEHSPCSSSFPTLLVFDSSEFLATSSATNLNSLAIDGPSGLTGSKARLPEYTPQGTPEIRRLLSHNITRLLDVTFEYSLGEGGQEDEGEMFDELIVKTLWPKNLAPTNPLSHQPNSPPQNQTIDSELDDEVYWSQNDEEEGDDDDILNLAELDRLLPALDPLSDSDSEMFDEPTVKTLWPGDLAPSNLQSPQPDSPQQTPTIDSELDDEVDWSQDDGDDEGDDNDDILNLGELDRLLLGLSPLSDSDSEMFDEPIVKTLWPTPSNLQSPQPNSPPQTQTIDSELDDEVDWTQDNGDDEGNNDDDILNLEELDRLNPISDSDDEY